jgi:hypothetical protein
MVTLPPNTPRETTSTDFIQEYLRMVAPVTPQNVSIDLPARQGLPNKMGFLGRTIDFLSRPMRIISNPVMKAVELPERFDKVNELRLAGDDAAATKEALSAVGSLAAAPFTGFFSDNPENKPYWSDIIERHSDVSNRNDPNYVDVANNVDPKVKGALGFVGDFVLDPLWLLPVVGFGGKIFKTGAKGAKTIDDVAKANAAAAAAKKSEEVYSLSIRKVGDDPKNLRPIQEFATRDEALAAVAAEQRKAGPKGRPWVDTDNLPAGQGPGKNTNLFTITRELREVPVVPAGSKAANLPDNVPASSISDKLTQELLDPKNIKAGESSAEFVSRTVGNLLNDAAKTPGGQNPLAEFLGNLAKTAAPTVKTAVKPDSFDKWLTKLAKDKNAVESLIQVPNSITLRGAGLGDRASMKYVLDMYKMTRNTEIKDAIRSLILEPAYGRYATGVKAGKTVNALGNAASSAAAVREVAQTQNASQLVNALMKLDDANVARLGEIMGDDFVALLRQSDPQGIAQFLDDFKSILLKTGSLGALGRATPDSLLGATLSRFDIDPTVLAQQVNDISRRIENIPASKQKSTAQAAESLADDAATQAAARNTLSEAGFADEILDSAEKVTRTVETLGKATYEKSRKAWSGAKNEYIARNKERLGLEDVDYDFANPQVSIYAPQIAKVYNSLVSDPSNPAVREAYEALVRESREQYDYMIRELDITVEFVPYDPYNVRGASGQMVPDSKLMMEDVVNNKHLFIRDSAQDFATDPHPIMSVEENNIFRAVHEFFGHAASGSNFRAAGEEAAWVSHSSMFSLQARRVLTTETRGQNSYYNFFDPQRKQFAPQKAALFPEEYVQLPTREDFKAFDMQALINAGYPEESVLKAEKSGRPAKGLLAAVLSAVESGLPNALRRKVDEKYLDKYYPHELGKARKNDPTYLEGVGVIPKEPATYFQFDLFLGVSKAVQSLIAAGPKQLPIFKPQGTKQFLGAKFAAEKERLGLAAMKIAEDFLIERGMPLTFDYQGVFHKMRFTQAYNSVRAALGPSDPDKTTLLTYVFFNANTGVAPTQFMEGVARALSGGGREDVFALLTSSVDRNGRLIKGAKTPEGQSSNFLAGPEKVGSPMGNFRMTNIQVANKLTDAIMDAVPDLQRISRSNAEDYVARGKAEGTLITQDAADYLVGLINSPEKLSEAIRAVANSERVVGDFARSVNATELGAAIANAAVKSGFGDVLKKNAEEIVGLEKAVLSGDAKKIQEANRKMFESAEEFQARLRSQAEDIAEKAVAEGKQMDNVPPGVLDDTLEAAKLPVEDQIATGAYATIQTTLAKVFDPINKFFNIKAGMHTDLFPWAHRLFAATGNNMHALAAALFNPLREITKNNAFMAKLTPESKLRVVDQALINIQKNVRSPEGTILREAEDAVRPLVSKFFDTSDEVFNQILGNIFFRTGAGIDAINDALAVNKVLGNKTPPTGVYFDKDLAEQTVRARIAADVAQGRPGRKVTDDEVLREMYNQWRTWDIEDPIEFLSQLHRAVVQTSVENSFAVGFRQKAFATGVASATPQKDFIKFTFAEDSRYAKYFGDEPMYMLPEAAEALEAIDKFTRTSKTFEGAFGKFTREVLDPFTDVWKYAVTLPRPGHHTRNMVGDVTLTYLAEGGFKALASTNHAIKTMAMKGDYTDVDVIRLITGSGLEMPKNSTVGVGSVKLKDGTFDFTYSGVYEDLIRLGSLPPAKGREGLRKGRGFDENEMGDPAFARILEKGIGWVNPLARRGGATEEFIMNVAEGRDHFVRMQHFWQILEKAKAGKRLTVTFGKTVDPRTMTREELLMFAADRVSKYHPDLATLAAGERKYLKRLMPFYHWNRGAFQAVMETAVMNPGRALAFPKASYNIAVAAGINPYSLYDPFPTDQMFPSFLSDEMQGPQFEVGGKYYGVRPGIVTFDVMNQLRTGNPVDAIMSNMNPAFKIPLELLIGTRIDTGARIRDYSDYIDASVPGVNYAANISGYSVTGSLTSLLSGGGFDRQLQYELGNKGTEEQLTSALNWLTGLGLVDYSRPTFIRYAQNEFRRENAPDNGRSPF